MNPRDTDVSRLQLDHKEPEVSLQPIQREHFDRHLSPLTGNCVKRAVHKDRRGPDRVLGARSEVSPRQIQATSSSEKLDALLWFQLRIGPGMPDVTAQVAPLPVLDIRLLRGARGRNPQQGR